MNNTSRRKTVHLATQATELMFAAPQVVAHRLARMTAPGAGVSRRDQREFHRMSAEKLSAFSQSWNDMAFQMLKANQQMTRAWMFGAWFPVRAASNAALYRQMQSSALQIIGSGLAPVRQRAVANAKRLRRAKAR